MITTIIFDFAGVLGKKLTPLFASLLQDELSYAEDCVIDTWETRNHLLDKGSLPEDEFWSRFRCDLAIPNTYPVEKKFLTCVKLDQKMVSLAKKLKKNGYTIGVLSNICPSAGKKIKQMKQLQGIIDILFLSCDEWEVKPERIKEEYTPEELYVYMLFEHRMREKGMSMPSRESILFIDDKDGPCNSARQHGWIAVKYVYNMDKLRRELREYDVRV